MGWLKSREMINGYSQLQIGMSKDDVIKLLGEPSGQRVRGGIETMVWSNSEFRGLLRGGSMERKIYVDFENNKVTGWDGNNMSASLW